MNYGRLLVPASERRLELEDAAWISGGDDIGSEMRNELGFAIAEGIGGVWLDEIVDSRRAAAEGRFGNLDEFKPGNTSKQIARLRAHALRMLQMTGIVERHAQFQEMALAARLELRKDFADVFAFCRKVPGAFCVFRNVTEQVTVFLHIGTASGGVGHDGVHVDLFENVDGLFCEIDGAGLFPCVHEQGSAAGLHLWSDDLTAFGGENARRGGIHLRKKLALDAAKEQANAAALHADGRSDFRNFFLRSELRK